VPVVECIPSREINSGKDLEIKEKEKRKKELESDARKSNEKQLVTEEGSRSEELNKGNNTEKGVGENEVSAAFLVQPNIDLVLLEVSSISRSILEVEALVWTTGQWKNSLVQVRQWFVHCAGSIENKLEERNHSHRSMKVVVPVVDCILAREINFGNDLEIREKRKKELKSYVRRSNEKQPKKEDGVSDNRNNAEKGVGENEFVGKVDYCSGIKKEETIEPEGGQGKMNTDLEHKRMQIEFAGIREVDERSTVELSTGFLVQSNIGSIPFKVSSLLNTPDVEASVKITGQRKNSSVLLFPSLPSG
jgi:hypothetical protein